MAYYDDDLYPHRESLSRKHDLERTVFRDEFAARERAYLRERDLRSGLPPLGPDDPYYQRLDELEARERELRNRGPRFSDPMFEPPLLSPKEPSLHPMDRPRAGDRFDESLPPLGAWSGPEGRRFGSVVVFPPKVPRFPTKNTEAPSNVLYVGTLPRNVTKHHIEELFSRFGRIQMIRLRHNYAHITFNPEDKAGLVKALELDGHIIKVGPTNSPDDYGPILVEFSIRESAEAKSEAPTAISHKEGDLYAYSPTNASALPGYLYKDITFITAAKSLKAWFDQGHCTGTAANTFYSLLTSTNTCAKRSKKLLKDKEDELNEYVKKHKKELENMELDCQAVIDVFQSASQQKARDHFTKAQRKVISHWSDSAGELLEDIQEAKSNPVVTGEFYGPPPTKKIKTESGVTKRELDQLKAEKAVATKARDMQISNLKGILAKFKEECPTEWEKISEGKDILKDSNGVSSEQDKADTQSKEESDGEEAGLEIIEEVRMEDVPQISAPNEPPSTELPAAKDENEMDLEDQDEEVAQDTSLAQAAAAYAQIRSTIGSTGQEGLSEPEIAIVSVLASFLAVHPLGATINEITTYFQGFNQSYHGHYIESLLRRLPKVFQLGTSSGDMPGKWWFMGFQTCYTAVGESRTSEQSTTEVATETITQETSETADQS